MISFLKRKFILRPVASALICSLATFIIVFEIAGSKNHLQPGTVQHNTALKPLPHQTNSPTQAATVASIDEVDVEVEQILEDQTQESMENFDSDLATLLSEKQFDALRKRLLALASQAVSNNDKNQLGYILNLLGQISIQEQDLYSAEVYLVEALDIFKGLDDEIGVAQAQLQLGRTHLKTRKIARVAGTAYDELQVGRWYLYHGDYEIAERYIRDSITKNLSINRYGSAASAYQSLISLYVKYDDQPKIVDAVFQSARLYSASGKKEQARAILSMLPEGEDRSLQLAELVLNIEENYKDYKNSLLQIERARDYRRLYRLYRNKGEKERAWKFRMLANNSLAQVSKRALFHRQQGVIAILYNSNESIDLAESYFSKAKQTFDVNGLLELADETNELHHQVF